jgi:hypothetical protein
MVGLRVPAHLLAFKLVATALVAAAILAPFVLADQGANVLGSLAGMSGWVIAGIVAGFLGLIALYCWTIQHLVERLRPDNRAMQPREVWLMFVPFFNMVEDFFIIAALTRSLRREAQVNPALAGFARFGAFSGFGWCMAQVASLSPGRAGEFAAAFAVVLWLWHWAFLVRVLRRLGRASASELRASEFA